MCMYLQYQTHMCLLVKKNIRIKFNDEADNDDEEMEWGPIKYFLLIQFFFMICVFKLFEGICVEIYFKIKMTT